MDNFEMFLSKCGDGNISAVQSFLSEGISPDIQNAEGETALQISSANGYFHIVKLLLKSGASVDLPNNYGWTPLMHAARHGHVEIVSFLIQMKAKVNVSNRLGLRPIDVAAWSGDLSCLKLIIEAGAVIDNDKSLSSNQSDVCDFSPLMAAALQGHNLVLRTLLEKGSAVNQASSITGLTSLMLAAYAGYMSIVETLIEFGGEANKTDICGRTALDLAGVNCKEDVVLFLEDITQPSSRKLSGGVSPDVNILRVIRSGDMDQAKSLLEKNQSLVNYSDPDDGVTPLMIACMFGFNNIVDILINNGANLNAQDVTNGWTPLMYAVFHRQAETVRLLLEKKANIDISTACGYTALDLAIHTDSSETDILGILLNYSESPEQLGGADYLAASSSFSTMKQSHLSTEKTFSRGDSQPRFKEFLGGFSSHFRQFSKSSAVSTTIDPEVLDESLYDVFLDDDDATETSTEGKFLCLSKFYTPKERFAHLVKEQTVEAINLPPLPSHNNSVDLEKTLCSKNDKTIKRIVSKPRFNSLNTPNLLKRMKNVSPGFTQNISENYMLTDSLTVRNVSEISTDVEINLKPRSPLNFKDEETRISSLLSQDSTKKDMLELSKRNPVDSNESCNLKLQNSDVIDPIAGGLTAILNEGSLKKYAKKFRDQEIDLECFQYLTEDDLEEMGINSFDSRHKLMEIIDKMKNS